MIFKKDFSFKIKWRRVVSILFLLFIPLMIFPQDDRAWFDPRDVGEQESPLFYFEYKNSLSDTDKGPLNFNDEVRMQGETTAPTLQGTLMIIVNAALYPGIEGELKDYTDQLLDEGYNFYLYTSSGGFLIEGVEALKQKIIAFRTQQGSDFKGCLFIGKLPTAWFQYNGDYSRQYPGKTESVQYVEFPCDLYFMDLDGTWKDDLIYSGKTDFPASIGGSDEIFDTHESEGSGDKAPEIWIARITADALGGSEAGTIGQYLGTKNLDYRNDYENSEKGELLNKEIIDKNTVPVSCIGPKVMDIIGSSVNRYIEPHLGGEYLFSTSNSVLAVIGSTKSGGIMEYADNFFLEFQNSNLGEAFLKWIKKIDIENSEVDDYIRKAYGMVIIGDPTVRQIAFDQEKVSIDAGIDYLLSDGQQLSNGSWSNNGAVTAFATLALINSGYKYDSDLTGIPVNDASIQGNWAVTHGINYLIDQIVEGGTGEFDDDAYGLLPVGYIDLEGMQTYYTSSAVLPIAVAARELRIKEADKLYLLDALEKLRNFLICSQFDSRSIQDGLDYYLGGFGYGSYYGRPDNSNTQFAIMGIRVANDTYRKLNDPRELDLWENTFNKCVDNWLEYTRNPNGIHGYSGKGSFETTMTAAALWIYTMCGYPADSPEFKVDGYKITPQDTVRSGYAADTLSYIEEFIRGQNSFYNPSCHGRSYYYTYTVAKALAMNRKEEITLPDTGNGTKSINWYEKISDFLIKGVDLDGGSIERAPAGQDGNGFWPSDDLEYTHGSLDTQAAQQLNTAWNINTLRIDRLPDKVNPNGPEDYTLAFILNSYSDLHVYDIEGRHTGIREVIRMIDDTEQTFYVIDEEIPGSMYTIYELDADGEYIREASIREFPDGVIPPTGFAQVVRCRNVQPDTFRAEVRGTATGTYDLTCELRLGDVVLDSRTYEKMPVVAGQKEHCFTKIVNIEGIEMYNEPIEPSASLQVSTGEIREYMKPGTVDNKITFDIFETANVAMEKVSVSCTSLIGKNGVKIESSKDISFNVPDDLLMPGKSSFHVEGLIDVPSNFQGPGTGTIKVASNNGGTKTINLKVVTNRAPVPDAGDDQLHYAGYADNFEKTVTLDGSDSSDLDSEELHYYWYYGSKTGNLLGEEAVIDVTLGLGTHTIFLGVDDGMERSWDFVVIKILNRAPTAVAGDDISTFAGANGLQEATVQLDGTGSTDPENDPLTYKWYIGETLIAEGPAPEVTLDAGIHTISLVVDDSVNVSEPDEITVTVVGAVQAKMWIWPKRFYLRKSWGMFHTSLRLPQEIKRENINDEEKIKLFSPDGESVTSFFDMIYPYRRRGYKNDKLDAYIHKNMSKCTPYYRNIVTVTSKFWKWSLCDLLKEPGTHTLYAVGKLKSGQYFIASVDVVVFRSYYHYHHHHHQPHYPGKPYQHKPKR